VSGAFQIDVSQLAHDQRELLEQLLQGEGIVHEWDGATLRVGPGAGARARELVDALDDGSSDDGVDASDVSFGERFATRVVGFFRGGERDADD